MKPFRYLYLSHGDAIGHTFNLSSQLFHAFLPHPDPAGTWQRQSSAPNPASHKPHTSSSGPGAPKPAGEEGRKKKTDLREHFRQWQGSPNSIIICFQDKNWSRRKRKQQMGFLKYKLLKIKYNPVNCCLTVSSSAMLELQGVLRVEEP